LPDPPDQKPPRLTNRILVLDSGGSLEPKNSLNSLTYRREQLYLSSK